MEQLPRTLGNEPVFNNPQEEIEYLRSKIQERTENNSLEKNKESIDQTISTIVQEHKELPEHTIPEPIRATSQELILALPKEEHDETMGEYIPILQEHGIYAALKVVEATGNPHLIDDFHRFLVAYLKKGYLIKDLKGSDRLGKDLGTKLYEISLPEFSPEELNRPIRDIISRTEQLIAGLSTCSSNKKPFKTDATFSFEIAQKEDSEEYVFYMAIPHLFADTFEKQILGLYPQAHIQECESDYNVFNPEGYTAMAYVKTTSFSAYPIKTYEAFEYDPMNVMLNAFSKLQRLGEGAAIQIVCNPTDTYYVNSYQSKLKSLGEGQSAKEILGSPKSIVGDIVLGFGEALFGSSKKPDDKPKEADQHAVQLVSKKIESPILETSIRIVASAFNKERANAIIDEIGSSLKQFDLAASNGFTLERVPEKKLQAEVKNFIFRSYNSNYIIPLSHKELASLYHFPIHISPVTSQARQSKSKSVPIPLGVAQTGIVLGSNIHQNKETPVYFDPSDRLRHMYVIGQTGTGKTTLLKNMIIQDIKNGDGVCLIDPHGSDVQEILAHIPPERYDDVIYFDPGDTSRPMGLNMLEYDINFPEQKTFVVNEMMSIFNKLFDMKTAGGPMFEQYFRNATMLVIDDPSTGNTLLDISRVLVDAKFREMKLATCKNPLVVQFWKEIAGKAGGEASLQNIVPYITSKFDVFLSNEIMRPIVSQSQSSFDFREVMDNKKILLVNLAKGRLGEINSSLLGLILVGKILMAALSRVDSFGSQLPPFYLYIDEFQNVTTPSISSILSEARKYGLSLNVAHQFIAQRQPDIKDSVFGNVGSMAIYRVGNEDAELLAKQLAPAFTASDIMNLENHHACMKMLSHGQPVAPFSLTNILHDRVNQPEKIQAIKELSSLKYGKNRQDIEATIMQKYQG